MSTEIVAAVNPFAMAARSESALAEAGSTREAHEVQAMMVIAKRFPRDPVQSTDAILQACSRPTLAENSLYSYSPVSYTHLDVYKRQTVITFDGGGKELGREVVKGHFIDPETVCCALGIAAVFAGIALTILFF